MKDSTLDALTPLVDVLRDYEVLDELQPMVFHLHGRDFIHFHERPDGLFADVLLSRGRVRMPVSTESEQAELLERIEQKLSTLNSHAVGKPERRRSKHRRDDP